MICNLIRQPDKTWKCNRCDWVYRGLAKTKHYCKASPKKMTPPLLRPELPLPTLAELVERVRRDIAERLNAERLDPELPAMMPEIVRRAAICHTNRCGKFNDQICTDRGGACTHWVRWMERLSFGQCGEWTESETTEQ